MKTIKEITEMAEKIELLPEVSEVAIKSDRLIITSIDYNEDEQKELTKRLENELKEITGQIPTPCDVNYRDWFIYL